MKPTNLLFLLVVLCGACGSSSYLIDAESYARVTRTVEVVRVPQPVVSEASQKLVFVNPQKLQLDRAEPLPDTRLRVRPRRPIGLIVGGAITFGLGAIVTAAGAGQLYCPPGYLCENGITVGTLLGVGTAHMFVGGILLLTGAVRWSPEVGRPGR